MATVSVILTDNQVKGAKDHFSEQDNAKALVLFNAWVGNHANQWYADLMKKDIDAISAALVTDPTKIAAIMAMLAV